MSSDGLTHSNEPRTAIVTGASRGIGRAVAEGLAKDGYQIVVVARSTNALEATAKAIEEIGGTAWVVAGDIADYQTAQAAASAAITHSGRLDLVVNNAGLIEPIARLADSDPQAWGHVIDVNYKGVYFMLRAALPAMLERGGGTVINISSGAATSALEGWSHYCSSKAAVLSLTRCVHKEYGDQGIRMIGLSPGTVATHMQEAIKASGVNPVSQMDWGQHIPSDWVAQAVLRLCGPLGDDYVGNDFSLKTNKGREAVGLPLINAG